MFCLTVSQHCKHGLFPGFPRFLVISHPHRFILVWIIYFGDYRKGMIIVLSVDSIWYIWKSRNDKIYSNKNGNLQEILLWTEMESIIWIEAQTSINGDGDQVLSQHEITFQRNGWQSLESTRFCYSDGAWKKDDTFTEQRWFCRKNGSIDVMMGAINFRRSL